MDILYLLIPLSSVLVLAIIGVFAWALHNGQFDDLEQQGALILDAADTAIDGHQGDRAAGGKKSSLRPGKAKTENP